MNRTTPALLTLASCLPGLGDGQVFEPSVSYEEVARVGTVSEENPLFIFGNTQPMLVDSTKVVFSDFGSPGRLVVADIRSGQGWEIVSRAGSGGPGEFNGQHPRVFTDGDTIRTLTGDGVYNQFLTTGDFVRSEVFRAGLNANEVRSFEPAGFLYGGILVSRYLGRPNGRGPEFQRVSQGFQMGGQSFAIDSVEVQFDASTGGVRSYPAMYSVRGNLIVHGDQDGQSLWIRENGGVTTVELEWPLAMVHVDGTRRIWIMLNAPAEQRGNSWLVLDSHGKELMRVVHSQVRDAFGEWMLTQEYDSLGVAEMVLYREVTPEG